jgi:hypothetical protein
MRSLPLCVLCGINSIDYRLSTRIGENGQMLGIQRVAGFRGCIVWRRDELTNTASPSSLGFGLLRGSPDFRAGRDNHQQNQWITCQDVELHSALRPTETNVDQPHDGRILGQAELQELSAIRQKMQQQRF